MPLYHHEAMTTFVDDQISRFRALVGRKILSWCGTEMALRVRGVTGAPDFHDPTVPYFQFLHLNVRIENQDPLSITTYQNDTNWGLMQSASTEPLPEYHEPDSIYRSRPLPEFPGGVIDAVEVHRGDLGDLERVVLALGDSTVSLIAGEVYEADDGSLDVRLGGDESVLVEISRHG